MAKKAVAIHLVEKGDEVVNLRCVDEEASIWETGNWWVGDATSDSLVGGKVYIHKGQKVPSHIGGEIVSFRSSGGEDGRRKVFRFLAHEDCEGVVSNQAGWGNEKKIIWQDDGSLQQDLMSEDEAGAFPEGREYYALHRLRERDGSLPEKVKKVRVAKEGKLACDVCDFDFSHTYGELGSGYIEAHHTVPVSKLNGQKETKMSDFALVCANCHRMLHRGCSLLSVDDLRAIVKEE